MSLRANTSVLCAASSLAPCIVVDARDRFVLIGMFSVMFLFSLFTVHFMFMLFPYVVFFYEPNMLLVLKLA